MTKLLLARHGESDWNAAGRWQGHADRPLTARGREQARFLADALDHVALDAVYASDLRRAWETAQAVAGRKGLEVRKLPELREVDVGSWSGLTRAEARELFPDGFRRWRDGESGWDDGETYEEMAERVLDALRSIADAHGEGQVLVVSHGGAIRAVHARAAGTALADYRRLHPVEPNAGLSLVSIEGDRISRAAVEDLD